MQKAKARFCELLDEADRQGAQVITRHGVARSVVLSMEEYLALKQGKKDFIAHLLGGPKFDDFEIERSSDVGRDFDFE